MKSNVCKIDKGTKDLDAIFRECEKVAVYNDLTHKQALQLRLLCEELDGMLPNIMEEFDGDLWIEFEDGVCKVNVSLRLEELPGDKKKELISIAKNKKNAAHVGIVGKIREAIENFYLDEELFQACAMSLGSFHMAANFGAGMEYPYLWSLEEYRAIVKKEDEGERWDELEKSVIASVADDVIVGVKGKQADIIIIKKFA